MGMTFTRNQQQQVEIPVPPEAENLIRKLRNENARLRVKNKALREQIAALVQAVEK